MATIELEKIVKRYGRVQAVHGIDLKIEDGEFVVFVGPSGCGKSTTLRMIAGLEDISDGYLRIGDEIVNERDPKQRNIAMVFQNYAIYPHMTVRQNIGFGLYTSKLSKAEKNNWSRILSAVLPRFPVVSASVLLLGVQWCAIRLHFYLMSHFPTLMRSSVPKCASKLKSCISALKQQLFMLPMIRLRL